MKNSINIYSVLIIVLIVSSCDIINNDIKPNEGFIKIISNNDFDSEYYAEDLIQTSDNGFIILGSTHGPSSSYVWQIPYIVKLDESGTVLWETYLSSPYVNPVGNIIHTGNEYYFFVMHETTLETHLIRINENDGSTELQSSFDNITYPVAVFQNSDNSILVQGYDNFARQTIFSKLSADFSLDWSQNFSLNEDAEEILINHISKNGKQYPFFIGESDDHFFFNGLYNYTFSLVFTNKTDGSMQGVMNGFRYDGAVSSAQYISGNNFAFSIFSEGDNYIFPNNEIDGNSVSTIEGLSHSPIPELKDDAKFETASLTVNGNEVIILASTTKTNQIKLYFFNSGSDELLFYKEYAEKNPIEVSGIIETAEGGLAILARTFVNGQFSRIYIAKVSPENLY